MAITFNHNDQVYVKDGKLGIGTASPAANMHIKINDSGATPISQQHLVLEHNSATGLGILTTSSTSGYIFFGDESDAQRGYISYSHPTDNMAFKVAGSERMRIINNGNVGIGTTSPSEKLHVVGNALFDGGRSVKIHPNDGYVQIAASASGGWATMYSFTQRDGTNVGGFGAYGSTGLTYYWIGNAYNTPSMVIKSSAVGIGTTTPNGQLAIKSGTNADLEFFSEASGSAIQSYNRTTSTWGYLRFLAGGGEKMRIHSDGNVGIGTTSPQTNLDVFSGTGGTLRLGTSDTVVLDGDTIGRIEFFSSDATNTNSGLGAFIDLVADGSQDHFNPNGDLRFGTSYASASAATTRMTIKGNGNVGIGTSSPSRHLHIHANTGSAYLQLTQASTGITDNDGFQIAMGAAQVNLINRENGSMVFETNNTEKLRITSAGNVGIGTTSPSYKLDVNGNVGITGDLEFTKVDGIQIKAKESMIFTIDSDNNDTSRVFQFKDGGGDILMTVKDTGTLQLPQYTAGLLQTDANGNVSLDTSTYATQTYVTDAVADLVDSAPTTLDTLNELAAALGDDANFSTTVTNSIATKVPLSGAATISGVKTFETVTGSNEDWINSPISILERDSIGTGGNGSDIYSPNINFHWRNRVSRSIWMDATGDFHFGEYSSTGVPGDTGAIYVGGGNSDNWNTAYTDRNKWDGGSTGLNAATGRTSLGLGSAATSNTGDFAAASHTHSGADITSGTIGTARLDTNVARTDTTQTFTGNKTFTGDNEFEGDLLRTNQRISSNQEYPLGHYTPGETVFELDPTWSDREIQQYFGNSNVSWDEVANAPGGYAVYINGSVSVGGAYGSGFPYIPIDQDGIYYMECWIKNAGTGQGHYMGSMDYEADLTHPSSGGGNPGSYGYFVMSNYTSAANWTKVSGYITGHHNSNTGAFETDATYFTPMALFNYTAGTGTRACWISGWKVIRVDHVGDRTFQDSVFVKGKLEVHTLDNNTSSTTALVMNSNEVEKRTLGSLAFDSTTLGTAASSDTGDFAAASHNQAWSTITSTPTTIAGYGITDALELGTTSTTALAGDTAIPVSGTDFDPVGTDNSTDVTLDTSSYDYLSISGQEITLGQIDYDTDIDNLPTLGTAAATDSTDYATAAQGALADSALQSFDITTQTDSKYLRSDTADTASELITFSKGISSDGNSKFYNWRAIDNTSNSLNTYFRIARVTSSQSSRFMITLAGRSTSYSDNSLPAMGHIVGQLNNDNNYDVVFYNHSTASSEVVTEVGIIDVTNTVVDIYVKVAQFAELTATGHISDGSFAVYSNVPADGNSSAPSGYTVATEYTSYNSGNFTPLTIGTTATTALAGNTAIPVSGTDFDPVGTDNSTDVTLVTTNHDYLSISGQAITLDAINLDDINGGSTAGILTTNTSGVISIDTNTYLTSYTESGNITTADSATNAFFAVPFVSTTAGSGKAVYKDANGFYYNPSTNNLSVGLLDLSDYGTAAAPAIRWSGDGDTGIFSGGSNSNVIGFSTQGTEKMRLDASGNLGINVTNPLYKLDVGGTIHVRGNSGTLIRAIGASNIDQTIIRVSNGNQTDDGDYGFSIKYMGTRTGNLNSLSIFSDGQQAVSQTEAITIAQNGIVGFTNASPTATVDIGGTLKASGAVTFSNYGAGFLKTDADGNLAVDTSTYLTSVAFSDLSSTPTTISGYGITDAFDGAYSSLTGTPALDNYVEWYLSGDADTQDITSGKWVKFEGASSITGLGTEVSPYIVDLSGINTDTQYTAGAGVTLSGTEFNVNSDLTGVVSSIGIDTNDKYVIKATTHEWSLDGTLDMRLSSDGVLDVDGDVVAFSTVTNSDRRLKTDIETIENASEKVSKLRGVSYTWDHGKRKGQRDIGLIAQEVEEVVPEVVSEGQLLDGTTAKRVDYAKLVGLLIESNKELQAQVNELKDRLDAITK